MRGLLIFFIAYLTIAMGFFFYGKSLSTVEHVTISPHFVKETGEYATQLEFTLSGVKQASNVTVIALNHYDQTFRNIKATPDDADVYKVADKRIYTPEQTEQLKNGGIEYLIFWQAGGTEYRYYVYTFDVGKF